MTFNFTLKLGTISFIVIIGIMLTFLSFADQTSLVDRIVYGNPREVQVEISKLSQEKKEKIAKELVAAIKKEENPDRQRLIANGFRFLGDSGRFVEKELIDLLNSDNMNAAYRALGYFDLSSEGAEELLDQVMTAKSNIPLRSRILGNQPSLPKSVIEKIQTFTESTGKEEEDMFRIQYIIQALGGAKPQANEVITWLLEQQQKGKFWKYTELPLDKLLPYSSSLVPVLLERAKTKEEEAVILALGSTPTGPHQDAVVDFFQSRLNNPKLRNNSLQALLQLSMSNAKAEELVKEALKSPEQKVALLSNNIHFSGEWGRSFGELLLKEAANPESPYREDAVYMLQDNPELLLELGSKINPYLKSNPHLTRIVLNAWRDQSREPSEDDWSVLSDLLMEDVDYSDHLKEEIRNSAALLLRRMPYKNRIELVQNLFNNLIQKCSKKEDCLWGLFRLKKAVTDEELTLKLTDILKDPTDSESFRGALVLSEEAYPPIIQPDIFSAIVKNTDLPLDLRRIAFRVLLSSGKWDLMSKETLFSISSIKESDVNVMGSYVFKAQMGLKQEEIKPEILLKVAQTIGRLTGEHESVILEKLRRVAEEEVDLAYSAEYSQATFTEAQLCEKLCRLAAHILMWDKKEAFSSPLYNQYRDAIALIRGFFLLKAAPVCNISQLFLRELHAEIPDDGLITSFCKLIEGEKFPIQREIIRDVNYILEREARARVRSGPEEWARLFGYLFFQEASKLPELSSSERSHFIKKRQELATIINTDLTILSPSDKYGSVFQNFAKPAFVLSQTEEESSNGAMQVQNDILKLTNTLIDLGIPYHVPYTGYSPDGETPRGAAARNVPIYGVRYVNDPSAANGELLIGALRNFMRYSPTLRKHLSRRTTHEGLDQIAPYYFYPALPYATALLKKLKSDSKMKGRSEELNGLESDLNSIIRSVILPDGHTLSDQFVSIPVYNDAFTGLAILPLIQSCGKKKIDSSGILSDPPASTEIGSTRR